MKVILQSLQEYTQFCVKYIWDQNRHRLNQGN